MRMVRPLSFLLLLTLGLLGISARAAEPQVSPGGMPTPMESFDSGTRGMTTKYIGPVEFKVNLIKPTKKGGGVLRSGDGYSVTVDYYPPNSTSMQTVTLVGSGSFSGTISELGERDIIIRYTTPYESGSRNFTVTKAGLFTEGFTLTKEP